MLDLSDVVFDHDQPVYIQLAQAVKRKILRGEAKDEETLPSRRELAAILGKMCIRDRG